MTASALKGIIFDFNGVIIDDYPLQKEAWSQISVTLRGKPVSDEEMIHNIRGVPTRDILRWMTGVPLREEKLEELARQKTVTVKEFFKESPLFRLAPSLVTFLNELSQRNIPRTIATSQSKETFTYSFARLGLNRWFDMKKVICYDGTYPGKPAPDSYILAASSLNLSPNDCVVIEDALSGIASAWAAGVQNIIAVGRDDQLKKLSRLPGVVKTIHNFTEIRVDDFFG